MKKSRTIFFPLTAVLLSLLLYFLFLSFSVKTGIGFSRNQIWNNYTTLLIEKNIPPKTAADALQAGGFSDLLYAGNAEVEYFDYSKMKRVPLRVISRNLDSLDPRFDQYLQKAARLFNSPDEQYNIIYVHTPKQSIVSFLKIRKSMHDFRGSWKQADPGLIGPSIRTAVFIFLLLVLIRLKKKVWAFILPAGIVWLPGVFLGTFSLTFAAMLIVQFFAFQWGDLTEQFERYISYRRFTVSKGRVYRKAAVFIIMAAGIFFFFQQRPPENAVLKYFLFAAIADIFISLFFLSRRILRRYTREHKLFFYQRIMRTSDAAVMSSDIKWILALLIILLAAPFLLNIDVTPVDTFIPQVSANEDFVQDRQEAFSLQNLKKNLPYHISDLPDFADYVRHIVFQEGFLYGYPYRLPDPGESVLISTFGKGKGGDILRSEKSVQRFTETWYNNLLEHAGGTGIPELFLAQNAPGPVTYKKIVYMPLKRREIIVYCLVWIALGIPSLVGLVHLTPHRLYDMKAVEQRRKCRAA